MTDLPYKLGANPSRPDPRDKKFSTLLAFNAPKVAEDVKAVDRKFWTMVDPTFRMDQGGEGTCVGHAMTNMLLAGPSEHDTFADFQTVELAHQYARALYLETTGDSTYQNGAYPRDACQVLLNRGTISSYWKVEQVDDIIACLLGYGPVAIDIPWYWSMFYGNGPLAKAYGNYWVKVNFDSEHVGYHELALTGIDLAPDNGAPPFVRLENSWGVGWGQKGTARLEIEKLRALNIWDNWTFAEATF